MIGYVDPDRVGIIMFFVWVGIWTGLAIIIPFKENKKKINKEKYMNNNDKKEVINLIDDWNAISFYELNEHSKECYYEIRNAILAMPEQEPKIGHWIKTISENGITSAVRCSKCGFEDNRYMLFRYCPDCGCAMVEPQESEVSK